MLSAANINGFNRKTFSRNAYSKNSHFDYFSKHKIDKIIYDKEINSEECDVRKYQNMLVYSYVTENLKPGSILLEIGNLKSDVSNILNSKGYLCWNINFKFIKTEIENNSDVKIEWELKDEKGNTVNEIPREFFDFSFSISAFVNIPESAKIHKSFLDYIKFLLKPFSYSLYCFLNSTNKEEQIWHNKFMDYLFDNVSTLNTQIPHSSILSDKNIFILSENYFNNFWKTSEDMTYEKNGKFFSYSVLWQYMDIFQAKGFQDFTYSKKNHIKLFNESGYSKELFGANLNENNASLNNYQDILFYSFVKSNLTPGSKILIVGKFNPDIRLKLSDKYNLFTLKNSNLLTDDILTDSTECKLQILDSFDERINFFPLKYFDLIFSFNGFIYSEIKLKEFLNLDINIYTLLSEFGLSFFSFTKYFFKGIPQKHELVRYLFLNTEKLNRFVGYKKMFEDVDLYTEIESNFHYNKKYPNAYITKVCYNLLWEYKPRLPTVTITKPSDSLSKRPAYVFHHLMKCGGTSVVYALYDWFNLIFEHTEAPNGLYKNINDYHRYKLNMDSLVSDTCIVAHFQHDGYFLPQRYPEVFHKPDKFRVFTFIREPLELVISLYYYSKKSIKCSLEHYINGQENFLANLFPCDMSNYKELIDQYFFIGIVEKMQESFDKLAELSGKPKLKLPYANKSKKDDQVLNLSHEFIKKFKERNELDYLIYNYCLTKFNNK